MRIVDLETFLRVSAHGSFSRAARHLDISQPSVSARVASLESSMGQRLFHREGNRMKLSAAGASLLPVAEEIVRLARRAQRELRAGEGARAGRLRLGCNASSAVAIVPQVLSVFRRRVPRIQVNIRVDSTAALMPLLAEGALELAFVNPQMSDFRAESLWTYSRETVLACSPDGPLMGRTISDFSDLASVPFVAYTVGPAQEALDQLRSRVGTELRVAIETNATGIAFEAIRNGAGVGFLPRDTVAQAFQDGVLGQVYLSGWAAPRWEVSVVRWRDRSLSPEAGELAHLLDQQGSEILGGPRPVPVLQPG